MCWFGIQKSGKRMDDSIADKRYTSDHLEHKARSALKKMRYTNGRR